MLEFHFECSFKLGDLSDYSDWLNRLLSSEGAIVGELNYIFCDDEYLLGVNQKYLGHEDFTDIISFDYSQNSLISGDIFISVDRVAENARIFDVLFETELLRVMAHGVLHFLGYGDKSREEQKVMRSKEEEKMKMFHVEQ